MGKDSVYSDMPKKTEKIKKYTVDIIVSTADDIKYSEEFNDNICLQVIPVRTHRPKQIIIIIIARSE